MKKKYFCDWTALESDGSRSSHPAVAAGGTSPQTPAEDSRETVPKLESTWRLVNFLETNTDVILSDARTAIERHHVERHDHPEVVTQLSDLKLLLEPILQSVRERRLAPVTAYMDTIAGECFESGNGIADVLTAVNALEEATWKLIMRDMESANHAYSLGLVSTVLGVAKDVLARTYLSLAGESATPTLNLTAQFDGRQDG